MIELNKKNQFTDIMYSGNGRGRFHSESYFLTKYFTQSRASLSSDVSTLIRTYATLKSLDFPTFKTTFDTLEFIKIHFVCVDHQIRLDFMKELFAHFIKYLVHGDSLYAKVAAVYGLYIMYNTQPPRLGVHRIPAMPIVWKSVLFLIEVAKNEKHLDLFYVCKDLLRVFDMVAYELRSDEMCYYMKELKNDVFPEKKVDLKLQLNEFCKKVQNSLGYSIGNLLKDQDSKDCISILSNGGSLANIMEKLTSYEQQLLNLIPVTSDEFTLGEDIDNFQQKSNEFIKECENISEIYGTRESAEEVVDFFNLETQLQTLFAEPTPPQSPRPGQFSECDDLFLADNMLSHNASVPTQDLTGDATLFQEMVDIMDLFQNDENLDICGSLIEVHDLYT
jgi:hypothetical protein